MLPITCRYVSTLSATGRNRAPPARDSETKTTSWALRWMAPFFPYWYLITTQLCRDYHTSPMDPVGFSDWLIGILRMVYEIFTHNWVPRDPGSPNVRGWWRGLQSTKRNERYSGSMKPFSVSVMGSLGSSISSPKKPNKQPEGFFHSSLVGTIGNDGLL